MTPDGPLFPILQVDRLLATPDAKEGRAPMGQPNYNHISLNGRATRTRSMSQAERSRLKEEREVRSNQLMNCYIVSGDVLYYGNVGHRVMAEAIDYCLLCHSGALHLTS